MLGPWLAGKVSLKGKFRGLIDMVFGIESIPRFRTDMKTLIGKHADLELRDRSAAQIQGDVYDIHEDAVNQAERGEFLVAIIAGVISLVAGTLTGISVIGWLVGIYSVLMTLTIGLQVVVLDILAFNQSDDLSPYRREELVLYEGWNRAILFDNGTQASVLVVGILYRISPWGYETGKGLLDEAMSRDMGKWESAIFISGAVSTFAEKIIRDGTN
ncbi:hypothetical protein DJ68_13255 [Halorubrum sp. C3]|nr:hypothetical protein DJ68_13255 [Halorubrum sp. C3]